MLKPTSHLPRDPGIVGDDAFEAAYGESLASALDLDSWGPGGDLAGLYERLEHEVHGAVAEERAVRESVRRAVLPLLSRRRAAPHDAGLYQATAADIAHVHGAVLFNGAVEACDGTSAAYDTLPLTITQIGVCLVNYQGDRGTWLQRLFRRDLRNRAGDPIQDALDLLEQRMVGESERQRLTTFARRGLMTYAERAILTYRGEAPWRLGHGNPTPVELLNGSGSMRLFEASLQVLRDLILKHRRFVFVPSSATDHMLLTIGQALRPLEYAIVDFSADALWQQIRGLHYRQPFTAMAEEFCYDVGDAIVRGVYRAGEAAPPYVFYAHVEHAHEAALIAMADSTLQEYRGFPLLIDLADTICRTTFGNDVFNDAIEAAYATAGEPFRHLQERATRP